jgi:hypothetical protein
MAVVVVGGTFSTILLNACSSKFRVPRITNWLKEVVVASLKATLPPLPLFQSFEARLQDPSAVRTIVSWHRPPPSRTER